MNKNNLLDMRIRKLMTQKELAKLSGVSQVTISFTENHLSDPLPLTKAKIANAFGVSIETIFPKKRGS
jgi:DNA-binding XRE family transcriptional regulator